MTGDRRDGEGYAGPTVDVLAATVGLGFVTYPLARSVLSLLGGPLPAGLVTGVVAVGGAYPFVAGPWSLGTLGDYVLVWTAWVVALAAVALAVAMLAGGLAPVPAQASQVLLFSLAHLGALVAVGVCGVAPTGRS